MMIIYWVSQSTRTTFLKGRNVFVQKNGSDKICRISGDLSDGDLEFDLEVDLGHNSRSKYRFKPLFMTSQMKIAENFTSEYVIKPRSKLPLEVMWRSSYF